MATGIAAFSIATYFSSFMRDDTIATLYNPITPLCVFSEVLFAFPTTLFFFFIIFFFATNTRAPLPTDT
jgi:hypothetical protein